MTSTERAVPYYCPFCGDEDLRPADDGDWLCGSCRRRFSVKFHGLSLPEETLR
ncbi:Insertion element protein [Amycolatopsis sp. FDAARGOS 1241]|uniref:Insertion element protein n=1 Tax=Amycolatopsis sp. FDAARGOS 1241 TaxID=2778070 RepID=UPI00194F83E2|nr:Insertion element protein [Amycolatopsis sp. FDAARGOS 1241]QRP48366.1 Insertion element protein [Amycolatopsis sp. FDAARGOS 1241]